MRSMARVVHFPPSRREAFVDVPLPFAPWAMIGVGEHRFLRFWSAVRRTHDGEDGLLTLKVTPVSVSQPILISRSWVKRREWMPADRVRERFQGEPKKMMEEQIRRPERGLPMRYLLVLWVFVLSTI